MQSYLRVLPLFLLLLSSSALAQTARREKEELDRIGHIIVVVLENRSFDHLYGLFPGADGIDNSGTAPGQVDQEGQQFVTLPAVINTNIGAQRIDTRFAFGFPNGPFRADRYVSLEEMTGDLVHRFYQEQEQIDGGKNGQVCRHVGCRQPSDGLYRWPSRCRCTSWPNSIRC